MITILYPWALLLLLLPELVYRFSPPVQGVHGDALRIPFVRAVKRINLLSGSGWSRGGEAEYNRGNRLLFYLLWCFLSLATARPQLVGEPIRLDNYGYDILMVTDISGSMREPDFSYQGQRIDRLTAVKLAAQNFINQRANDRIGLILFGSRAYMQAPLTFDKSALLKILLSADAGMAGNSTAIGDAVGLALKKFREMPRKSASEVAKIIILLTDGENNDGSLSMPEVLKLAQSEKVKIYTIGVSSESRLISSFFNIKVPQTSSIDETSLKQLADNTKGNYFRASDTDGLQRIYREIDKLEPSLGDERYVQERYDLFYYPLVVALVLAIWLLIRQRRGF